LNGAGENMSSIARTGLDFFYPQRWQIATLSISTILVCSFKKEWIIDPDTKVPGIVCAIIINTAVCTALSASIQNYWSDYWKRKYKEATQLSQEVEAVQNNRKKYEQAQQDLEKAHIAIKEIQIMLDSATRDKAREVEIAKDTFNAAAARLSETLRIRNELITKTVTPAIEGLKNKTITKLLEDESKIKDSPIYQIVYPMFSNLDDLQEFIFSSRTNNKLTFDIPKFKESLEKIFKNLKQIIYEIEKYDGSLLDNVHKDEEIVQRLNKIDQPAAEEVLAENTRIKNSEGAQKKYLEGLLEKASTRMKDLDSEMDAINLQAAKLAYDRAGHAYNCNQAELDSIKKHSSNETLEAQNTLEQFLGLKTYDQLFKDYKTLEKKEPQVKAKTQEAKKALETITVALRKDIQEQLELLGKNLAAWLEDIDKKRAEILKKKDTALDNNNPSKKPGFLPILSSTAADPEFKKLDQQRKIEIFFSDLLKILDSCKLQYKKPNSPNDSSVKTSLVFEIPDWSDSEHSRRKAIDKFLALTQSIQNQDLLLPLIIKLRNLLNASPVSYEDLGFTRLFIKMFKSSLNLDLKDDFKKTFSSFNDALNNYLICLKKQEDLAYEIKTVYAEYERRERRMTELQQLQTTLQTTLDRTKEQYTDKKSKHFKNRGEYGSLKAQMEDTYDEKEKIETACATIDTVIEKNKQAIATIKNNVKDIIARIEENRKLIKNDESKLIILRDGKGKLETFTITLAAHAPSILDQLDSKQKEFQAALEAAEAAEKDLTEKQKDLKNNTSDLTDAKDAGIRTRETKLIDLQKIEKEEVIDSIKKLQKKEYDAARLNLFLQIIGKCDTAKDLFEKKYANPKDTSQKIMDLSFATHNITKKMLHAKIELALKKQAHNLYLQRARASELTEEEAANAQNTNLADVNKHQLLVCQLERYQAELDWRVAPIDQESMKRTRIEKLLQDEEMAIYQYFRMKILLPSSKGRGVDAHNHRCHIQVLLAFIDLFLAKMRVDLSRHHARPQKKPEVDALKKQPEAASPKDQLPVEAPKEKPDLIKMLIGHMKNPHFTSLLTKKDHKQSWADSLTEALDQDQKAHKNPLELPKLTMFFQELRRILGNFDITNIPERKIPEIEAKIDLVNHLTKKPYNEDELYKNNTEAFQNARNKYRKIKYEKRIKVEKSEKHYIKGKTQFKKYEDEEENARKLSYRSMKETIIEYPAVETVSYLVPVVVLIALYSIKMNRVFSGFNALLSDPASITIWKITTALYVGLQILSPRVDSVFKKAISQP
jgi:hypothetical protein